jgi:tRNA(Ile)-lysidine synthase TilS/MesJ
VSHAWHPSSFSNRPFIDAFGSKLKGMPAKLVADDGKHMVIRPMACAKEPGTERYTKEKR